MPVTPTYPGVYVQEVPSGVRTIVGVSTSIALFVGRAKKGSLFKPKRCLSYSDFVRGFSDDATQGDLARQVRLFFANGGTDCYVVRVAKDATYATVDLLAEDGTTKVLTLTAKDAGLAGESIRAAVTYSGPQPEATFNLELFRWETNARGQLEKTGRELWTNLSMDENSARYAPDFVTQNSKLVGAELASSSLSPSASGYSQSGRPVAYDSTAASGAALAFDTVWAAVFGDASGVDTNRFEISVDGGPYVKVNLGTITVAGTSAGTGSGSLASAVEGVINTALPAGKTITVEPAAGPAPPSGATEDTTVLLKISSTTGDVLIRPSSVSAEDLAGPLMLGAAQGGLEVSRYASLRPAPTGITFDAPSQLVSFAALEQDDFNVITIGGKKVELNAKLNTVTTSGSRMYQDGYSSSATGNSDGVREKWAIIAQEINQKKANDPTFKWSAEVWGSRLALIPASGGDNSMGTIATSISSGGGTDISSMFNVNVRYYSVGVGGTTGFQQAAATQASDGDAPELSDYEKAYKIVDKEVDLFNLMVLPEDAEHTATTKRSLWGPASTFCQKRRAFLLMDPPAWKDVQEATHAQTGVSGLRVGLVKDYSAIFYPRVKIRENGLEKAIGPSGTIAGLMARIDSTRGVWKAPAGTEADLLSVVGLEYQFSDPENGVLNKRAINTLRVFPNGIVNWGARTMDGDDDFASEYKYIPIRRLALYIEESLYRGLKWVVFEPNDEPLWAQIRLNVGAFMHDLFRKGAFQGQKPKDAYFVKCDAETTTQSDRNLGIVNIWVGFAPLKPAEFVIIYLQQMAGQVQT
jgi:phage tail sheath protein FI